MVKILLGVCAFYGLFAGLVYLMQDALLFAPEQKLSLSPADEQLPYEDVFFVSEDNVSLHGWFIPAKQAPKAVLLFSHGNAGNISHRLLKLKMFHEVGLSVFIYDYRGYGLSQGKPSEQGTYLDVMSAWQYLTSTKNIAPSKIVLYGESLGSAISLDLATKVNAGALILEAPFASIPMIAKDILPLLPVKTLSKYSYDSLSKISQIQIPTLFIHSRADEVVPFRHSEMLFNTATMPKEFLEISGGHNDGFWVSKDIYIRGILDFLTKYKV